MQVIYVAKNSFMRAKYDMTHKHNCLLFFEIVKISV